MNKVIVCGNQGDPSVKGVYAQMNLPETNLFVNSKNKKLNKSTFKLYTDSQVEKFTRVNDINLNDSIFIRWGTRIQIPENRAIVYNTNKGLANASNKFTARKLFRDAGVRIPKLITPEDFQIEDLPIIARPFQHRQGKNFVVIKDYGSFVEFYKKNSATWYFSAYIEKTAEYRAHLGSGRLLSLMKKPKPVDPNMLAWNHAVVDEAFEAVKWADWNIDLCKTALRACKALTLDFCAIDLIEKDGLFYVLEANTCPSLVTSPYNTEKYAKYFNWLLRKDELRPHWEFEEKKKAKSLAWKDWMFEDRKPVEE